ncbi:MAG: SPOR domain-containing protein [Gammaproteobacteria bacterium]|nr:SPOR domain-containing protein [Gammaproteobacteria bacterium]
MERRLKERLIGASVLVMLAVILIPMILDDSSTTQTRITQTNIPTRPAEGFTSDIVPLPEPGARGPRAADAPAQSQPDAGQSVAAAPVLPAAPGPEGNKAQPEPAKPEPPAQQAPTPVQAIPAPERVGLSAWVVQLGSFSSEDNAKSLSQKLRDAGYAAFVEPIGESGERTYRVRVGPELLKSDAQALADRLKANMRLDGIVLAYP